jgi:hypothetical protein
MEPDKNVSLQSNVQRAVISVANAVKQVENIVSDKSVKRLKIQYEITGDVSVVDIEFNSIR